MNLTKSQQLVSERLTKNLQEDRNTIREINGIELGMRGVWQRSSQKILEVNCVTRDKSDP